MTERPTFSYNGLPVRAAGTLIIVETPTSTHRLFRQINNKFEDIGGKTDSSDTSEIDTAVRETCEETHGKLFHPNHTMQDCERILRDLIATNCQVEYNKRSKYLLFKLYVHEGILDMSMKRFGLEEKTDWGVLQHYYKWLRYCPRKLHPRLYGMAL